AGLHVCLLNPGAGRRSDVVPARRKRGSPMQDRYLQAKALAMEALELAADAREAWLQQQCAGDAELRAEVDWLITAARTWPDDPLAPGWLQAGAASLPEGSRIDAAQPGQYRILRLLGEGGMGVVYLAERDDGDAR